MKCQQKASSALFQRKRIETYDTAIGAKRNVSVWVGTFERERETVTSRAFEGEGEDAETRESGTRQ